MVYQIQRWVATIEQVLAAGKLTPGDAGKLAGKLAWGCSHMFKRFARAMLRWRGVSVVALFIYILLSCIRPIFDQKTKFNGDMGAELKYALEWCHKAIVAWARCELPYVSRCGLCRCC